jgi:hypothetical protein
MHNIFIYYYDFVSVLIGCCILILIIINIIGDFVIYKVFIIDWIFAFVYFFRINAAFL